jgi:ribose 5-phosphate isomerase A
MRKKGQQRLGQNMTTEIPMPANAQKALEYVKDGAAVGLGTGRAATAFVRALGARVQAGLRIRGVPTSQATADFAAQLSIPLTTLEAAMPLDVAIDGADEVDPQLNLIKGLGGALVREKIVAAAAKQLVILVDTKKLVKCLGDHHVLPVEVVPFGLALCQNRLADLGYPSNLRMAGERRFISDNGNYILDCQVNALANPVDLEARILAIPGVVGTGLFLGMAPLVLVQDGDAVHQLPPSNCGT